MTAIPNGTGIALTNVSNSIVGGATTQARNVISGNRNPGIVVSAGPSVTDVSDGNRILGNYIGTDATGNSAIPNSNGINVTASGGRVTNTVIGGTEPGAANILSGNHFSGVFISTGVTTTTIQGNFIGTNALGTAAIGNAASGLNIGGSNTTIGGVTPGAMNVISGNGTATSFGAGINIFGDSTVIQGNRIGTNTAGTAAIPNVNGGVNVNNSANNIIGGITAGAGNLISGNGTATTFGHGVYVFNGSSNTIQGNRIGTDASGTLAIPNAGSGIGVFGASGTLIGAPLATPGGRNVISGNSRAGINVGANAGSRATNTVIKGNLIGVTAAGSGRLPNTDSGVFIGNASQTTVGGTTADANVISANDNGGIVIFSYPGFITDRTVVAGNLIGTDASASIPLGNAFDGVFVGADPATGSTTATMIGGTAPESRNVIAFNGLGVTVSGSATGTSILGNSIDSNRFQVGIDLNRDGVTPNDPLDVDAGPNGLQNFPVLTTVTTGSVSGTLNSAPNTTFRVEFFANAVCDPSAFGEGQRFLGAIDATSAADGNASFQATFAASPAVGEFITATATDPNGNTSEFSRCVPVNPFNGLSPTGDEDHDGLSNEREQQLGTDPFNPDTDGDGWPDGVEVDAGSDPLSAPSTPPSLPENVVREALSAGVSLLNTSDPSTGTSTPSAAVGEASSFATSILNTSDPSQGTADPTAAVREAAGAAISILNTSDPSQGTTDPTAAVREAAGAAISILNTTDPSLGSSSPANAVRESQSVFVSIQNTASLQSPTQVPLAPPATAGGRVLGASSDALVPTLSKVADGRSIGSLVEGQTVLADLTAPPTSTDASAAFSIFGAPTAVDWVGVSATDRGGQAFGQSAPVTPASGKAIDAGTIPVTNRSRQ